MAFYTLVVAQLLNVFNMAERRVSFFKNEIIKNPWVWSAILISILITGSAYFIEPIANALVLISLSGEQFALVFIFAFGSMVLAQLLKRFGRLF